MAYREFLVPADEEILDALGVEPESTVEEPLVRVVRVAVGAKDVVVFSYDVVGCSVRCQWLHCGKQVFDLFREAATRLTVTSGREGARIVVRFETDALAGELHVQLDQEVRIDDRLLIR